MDRRFETEYSTAMLKYLEAGGEASLQQAYEMGRKALYQGQTLLDVSRFHAEVLLRVLEGLPQENHQKAVVDGAAFFSEFLSPFEMTFRGFLETVAALKNEITERRSAEEALQKSEKYYKSLIENALDVVTILDANGTVIYTSPSGERVMGYDSVNIVGKNVFQFVHPEDVDFVLDIFSAGKSHPQSTARAEFRFKHRNGEWLIMESIGKNLLDDPLVRGIIVNSRDITERRNLEEIRRRYEFIVNASQEYLLLVNSRYLVEAVNEACCVAFSRHREEIVGKRIHDVLDEELYNTMFEEQIKQCLSGIHVRNEGWFTLSGQRERYLEIDCYPYRNNLSAVTHAIVIVRDATERKKSEDEIRLSQEQRAEVMRRYAHLTQNAQEEERRRISRELHDEIGQRLTALNLRIDEFEESVVSGKSPGLRKLKSVKKEVSDLFGEIRRISHNLRPSALDHFGLMTALRYLCKEITKVSTIKVDFETNIPARRRYDPEVETAFYRIAQEALSNCVKHANVKQASLNIKETDGMLELIVADRGSGFNFDEFQNRADAEQHFGMINMKERIELCGGTFSINSSAGNGTTIKAIAPVVKADEK